MAQEQEAIIEDLSITKTESWSHRPCKKDSLGNVRQYYEDSHNCVLMSSLDSTKDNDLVVLILLSKR